MHFLLYKLYKPTWTHYLTMVYGRYNQHNWIGLRENLQETMILTIKYRVFLYIFPSLTSRLGGTILFGGHHPSGPGWPEELWASRPPVPQCDASPLLGLSDPAPGLKQETPARKQHSCTKQNMWLNMYVCMYVCMFMYLCLYIFTSTYMHIHAYIYNLGVCRRPVACTPKVVFTELQNLQLLLATSFETIQLLLRNCNFFVKLFSETSFNLFYH